MPPVKKQKQNRSSKDNEKKEKMADEPVISGQLQKKIEKKQNKPIKDPKGVVFIKHLPHGFFEEQLKKYFEQFGRVTRVRLARSKRTGNSKGYAFVEFEYPEVAEVAAETMDNYLMFKKIIKASYIPPEKQQFNYFRTSVKQMRNKSGRTVWVSSKTAAMQQKMKQHNDWSEENYQKRTNKQLNKIKKLGEKYAHLGIDINKIIVEPNTLTEEDTKPSVKSKVKLTKETASNSKVSKRKSATEDTFSPKEQNSKKSKKNVSLIDLLGNTIQEDSEDEDYVAMPDSETEDLNEESSDEETYGFAKDSDDGKEKDKDSKNESDEEETTAAAISNKSKKTKNSFGKSLKSSNVERFDQMLKRKPHTGGVQKLNKKHLKPPTDVDKKKGALKLTAAKEMAKPLPKLKAKLAKGLKFKKSVKKIK